ncbi:MAG: orotate phosphoribosyltransferase [Candidatus Syntrophonatronum acetioxidans]|uniref:Orotate phosphoribosyltransferase n=1 Tax=Candidatus Syntrophonatronum acetioxidans TaxID=1795816 RepID=A0A424YIE1_9FIRM|nr:MAG: orotate phosphoribosyltransferase [Candidatus Syntrophonatronum acetioxidans]
MKERVMEIFKDSGVLLEGHFILTSGRHSEKYLQCAQVLQYPDYTAELCKMLVGPFKDKGVEVVIGPAMGGIIIAYEGARQLKCKSIFAEREDGKMALRRGFGLSPGEKVLVVEDVITTGGSVKEVIELAQKEGAEVLGVSSFVDRSGGEANLGVPWHSLITFQIETFTPQDCPLCEKGLPLVKPGSRKV